MRAAWRAGRQEIDEPIPSIMCLKTFSVCGHKLRPCVPSASDDPFPGSWTRQGDSECTDGGLLPVPVEGMDPGDDDCDGFPYRRRRRPRQMSSV